MIPSWAAWPLTAFGATAVYLISASLQLAIAECRDAAIRRAHAPGLGDFLHASRNGMPSAVISFVTAMTVRISRRPDCLWLVFKSSRSLDVARPSFASTETLYL